jgi:hypothetical protein
MNKDAVVKKSYKAVWLSGLVFPGLGYLLLSKPKQGVIVMLTSVVCLFGVIELSLSKYYTLMDLIVRGKVAPDMASLLIAMQDISVVSMGWQEYAGYGFLLCWGGSTFDAIRLAKKNKHT